MVRRAISCLVVSSLLISVGMGLMCLRSYWIEDQLIFPVRSEIRRDWPVIVRSGGGYASLYWHSVRSEIYENGVWIRMFGPQRHWGWLVTSWKTLPFGWPTSFHMLSAPRYMTVPYWGLMAAFGLPGVVVLVVRGRKAWRRRKRRLAGQCAKCGYDLRATPERCPECGVDSGAALAGVKKRFRRWPIAIAGGLCLLVAGGWVLLDVQDGRRRARYQKMADDATWRWSDDEADGKYSIERAKGVGEVSIIEGEWPKSTVQVSQGGRVVYQWGGWFASWQAFVARGTRLVYADYLAGSDGCTLVCVDLETGEVLWRNSLYAVGMVSHSKYLNSVALDLDGDAVVVRGNESAGKYMEIVDFNSGETLGHREFSHW